jgi:hypothetical protein
MATRSKKHCLYVDNCAALTGSKTPAIFNLGPEGYREPFIR